jgi:hypothetical protein
VFFVGQINTVRSNDCKMALSTNRFPPPPPEEITFKPHTRGLRYAALFLRIPIPIPIPPVPPAPTPEPPEVVPEIGSAFQGGFFAGFISHTADGHPTHALIVAPEAEGAIGPEHDAPGVNSRAGYSRLANRVEDGFKSDFGQDVSILNWKTGNSNTLGTASSFDGQLNTQKMEEYPNDIDKHPAAKFCRGVDAGGFTDWYLPARFELDIAYQNLKPTDTSNNTLWGFNPYAVPPQDDPRTEENPPRTTLDNFVITDPVNVTNEAFRDWVHVTSSQTVFTDDPSADDYSDYVAPGATIPVASANFFTLYVGNGGQFVDVKSGIGAVSMLQAAVRAFRRVPVTVQPDGSIVVSGV